MRQLICKEMADIVVVQPYSSSMVVALDNADGRPVDDNGESFNADGNDLFDIPTNTDPWDDDDFDEWTQPVRVNLFLYSTFHENTYLKIDTIYIVLYIAFQYSI